MRVAVIHDWLYIIGGAERVLQSILRCYPQADLFCLFDILPEDERRSLGLESKTTTSFIQHLPRLKRLHRLYLPFMPMAIEQLDLSAYDLVISSSYAVAKGVLTGPDQLHVSYVHSPMRYAWDLQHQYLRESGMAKGSKSALARLLLHKMRVWDVRTAHGVNEYIANSHFISRRIAKLYGRKAAVIYPPVRVPDKLHTAERGDFFLTASRLVPYKNTRAVVEAFRHLPNEKLLVAGRGPELERLKAIASDNVSFLGFVADDRLEELMATARAFVFAAEEDFGIVVVEAQAHGTPVLALGRGGVRETVVADGSAPTGLFFDEPSAAAIVDAVKRFRDRENEFIPENCHRHASRYSTARFEQELRAFVDERLETFRHDIAAHQPTLTVAAPALVQSAA